MRSACSITISVAFGHVHADLDHRRRDQELDLAGRERAHDRRLFLALQPPVHEPELELRKGRGERVVRFERRFQLQRFRFLDQRADPVRLAAGHARVAHALDHLARARIRR